MSDAASSLPLISVIVPIYNMSSRMDNCIRCLLAQTYQNLEFLLVDDGSYDDSWDRILNWAQQDARIRPFHKENGGVSSARNYGLDRMKGDYGTFVDPDDTFSSHLVEWLYDALQAGKTPLSVCSIRTLEEQAADVLPPELSAPQPIRTISLAQYDQCAEYAHVQCYGALYRSDILQQIRFDEHISYGEDVLFFTHALLLAGAVSYQPSRLYYYIVWNDSALHKAYNEKQFSDVTVWETICDLTRDTHPILYESSLTRYMFSCTRAFYYSFTSTTDCSAVRKEAVRRLRKNWRSVLNMPPKCQKERTKALIAMFSPALGEGLWKLTRNA